MGNMGMVMTKMDFVGNTCVTKQWQQSDTRLGGAPPHLQPTLSLCKCDQCNFASSPLATALKRHIFYSVNFMPVSPIL